MKISQVVALFWLEKKLELSDNSYKSYSYSFRYLVDFLKDCEFEGITIQQLREFTLYLAEERKMGKRSIHDNIARIASLWTWASKELKITNIFSDKKISIRYVKKEVKPFTQDEVERLIKFSEYQTEWRSRVANKKVRSKRATHLLDKAMILTLLDSGIRVTELCNLVISDYDPQSGKLLVRSSKNYKQRYVIVGMRARKALFRYLDSRKNVKPNSPLFSTRTDTHFDKNNIRHKLNSIATAAQVTNVHPHRFRHTFSTQFLRNGGNLLLLKELLGHSSLEMVKHYAKIAETDIDSADKFSISDNWKL